MLPNQLIAAFITLFVLVDPVGLGPIFVGLTPGMGTTERRVIAVRASAIAFGVLAGAALIGDWLLHQLGIGLPAFRIAGGLLLFAIAFEIVFGRRHERKTDQAVNAAHDATAGLAAFPLAIPLMAGPGAITASILLAARMNGDLAGLGILIAIIAMVITCCFLVFLAAPQFDRLLGHTGQIVFTRLLGVLLAALAVQYVVDGILAVAGAR